MYLSTCICVCIRIIDQPISFQKVTLGILYKVVGGQ